MPDRESSGFGAAQPCTEHPAPRNRSCPQMLQWEANDRRTSARPHPCLVLKRAKRQAGCLLHSTVVEGHLPRGTQARCERSTQQPVPGSSYRYLGGQKRCPAATERRRVWGQGQGQGECAASNFFLFALPPVTELARQLSLMPQSSQSSLLIHAAIRL